MLFGTAGQEKNLAAIFLRFLLTFLRLYFFARRVKSFLAPAKTAALILLLLLVLALGMSQQPFTKGMMPCQAGGFNVFGVTGPQACLPSNHPSASNTAIKIPKRSVKAGISLEVVVQCEIFFDG